MTCLNHPSSFLITPLERKGSKIQKQDQTILLLLGDLGRIQTCNLLSRNQMRYSVAPRGQLKLGANINEIMNANQIIKLKTTCN